MIARAIMGEKINFISQIMFYLLVKIEHEEAWYNNRLTKEAKYFIQDKGKLKQNTTNKN